MFKIGGAELLRKGEDGDGDGEIEMSAIFVEGGRSEIDGDLAGREDEIGVGDGGTDAFSGFCDGFGGHADNSETGEAAVCVAFNLNKVVGVAFGDG